ncbi:MAG: guanine permease [Spirochaetae bacterium HGW-Spirochaetae-4]|nr:MAG: guanine permease [Spirochaetes bacterium GWF2_52_7]PKL20274.1 MAG: guanine permease [Spirochaetae bacterium HGW-Spirochaetae-4]HCS37564.1 guanine permease [Sphaerochaeta sp.]
MEKIFKLSAHKTTVRTELLAGATTFLTMAYILIVNPLILADAGMDFGAVFTATALSAAIATLVMAFLANLPFALAPGMGLNAFFAYTVVITMGYTWQQALTAVFIEGLIFILLTAFNIREAIVNSIPNNMKKAISVGIGLFIAFIGLQNAGIIVDGATLVELGDVTKGTALVAMIGLVITGILVAFKVRGALLLGIVATTIVGIPMGVTSWAGGSFMPPSLAPTFLAFSFKDIFSVDMIVIVFTFLFVDMFDTVGTLIGCATKADILEKDGSIPKCKEALFADAIGTTVGAMLGTSTVTTYVESSAGVTEGGKTGLTSLTVAVLFLVSLFLSPLFISIPGAATAPTLILVGLFMISPVKDIDFEETTEALPAFLTILFMVTSYSIANGIMYGALSWILLKLFTGKAKQISPTMVIIAVLLLLKLLLG